MGACVGRPRSSRQSSTCFSANFITVLPKTCLRNNVQSLRMSLLSPSKMHFSGHQKRALPKMLLHSKAPTGHKDEYEHCLLGALSCSSCSSKPGGQPTKQCCKGVAQHRARFALKCQAGQLGGGFGSTNGVLS